MSKPLLCRLGIHKYPPNPKDSTSVFIQLTCLHCPKYKMDTNFYLPWEKKA